MLLGGKKRDVKQVAIITRNQKFNRLLGSILADWKFFSVSDVCDANIVIAERGLDVSNNDGQVVWLTPLPLNEGEFLLTPVSLTKLYHILESHFFPTPRHHIRVEIEARAEIRVDAAWHDCKLISLSDRGGRFVCDHELSKGTQTQIDLKLSGRHFQMSAEVLYCIPAGDVPGRSRPQIGILFKPDDEKLITLLRQFIEKRSVEAACAREDIALNDPCLSWLDVPGNPWSSV